MPFMMVVVALGLFIGALNHPRLFEDDALIRVHFGTQASTTYQGAWWRGPDAYPQPGIYAPLAMAGFRIQARLLNLSPWLSRFINILFLAAAGWLAALWISRYTHPIAAWLAAILFVAHPAQAQLIHQFSHRGELMAIVGLLGFLYLQRRALESASWRWPQALLAVAALILALGSSETGLVTIPLALLQDWLYTHASRNPLALARGDGRSRRGMILLHGLGLAVCMSLYIYLRTTTLTVTGENAALQDLAPQSGLAGLFASRLAAGFSLAWFYLRSLLSPSLTHNQIPTVIPSWSDLETWLGLVCVTTLIVLLPYALWRRRWLALALTMALGQWLLVNPALFQRGWPASNRFMPAFLLAAACSAAAGIHRLCRGSARRQALAMLPVAAAVTVMAATTLLSHARWASEFDRIQADIEAQPSNPIAMFRFGAALARRGQDAQAMPWLTQAVQCRPDSAQAHFELGQAFLRMQDLTLAQEHLRQACARAPQAWQARTTLAQALLLAGKDQEAQEQCQEAERLAPFDAAASLALAELDQMADKPEQALRRYQVILLQEPNNREAWERLTQLQASNGGFAPLPASEDQPASP